MLKQYIWDSAFSKLNELGYDVDGNMVTVFVRTGQHIETSTKEERDAVEELVNILNYALNHSHRFTTTPSDDELAGFLAANLTKPDIKELSAIKKTMETEAAETFRNFMWMSNPANWLASGVLTNPPWIKKHD